MRDRVAALSRIPYSLYRRISGGPYSSVVGASAD